MNTKERILATLRGERSNERVVWVPTVGVTVEAMKQVDASWPESHWDPKKLARAAASTYELTGVPCCTVPFCLTLEGEALGCPLDKGTGITQPQIMEHLETGFDEFEVPENFLERGRIPAVLEAISLLAASQRNVQPVNMKVTGPFTIACAVFGAERVLLATIEEPEAVKRVMEKMAQVGIALSHAALKAGVDTITLSDPVASGDLLSGDQYAEFARPYEQKVFAALKGVPTSLHICGYTKDLMPHIASTGTRSFSFEEKVEVRDAKQILGDDVLAIGNVAPVRALLNGSPADVLREANKCFEDGIDLLSSGCAVPPLTKLENLRAMADAARTH
ncbi:MAG TPA: MtaA/CmuA family methyltransferase [Burkholderiales bacterium]|nr:MtaA/CmuA family methyltransferase [Burkholderiales bacterium]